MLDIIKKFKNREFCIDRYTKEAHNILMNEEFEWKSGNNYDFKWDYKNVGVASGVNLTWNSDSNKTVKVNYFIGQYNKELSESLYVDLRNFTKNDLQVGQVVELRNGEMGFVLPDRLITVRSWHDLEDYNDDLKAKCNRFDIIRVYDSKILVGRRAWNFGSANKSSLDLIWHSDNKKEKLQKEMQELLNKANEIKKQIDEM